MSEPGGVALRPDDLAELSGGQVRSRIVIPKAVLPVDGPRLARVMEPRFGFRRIRLEQKEWFSLHAAEFGDAPALSCESDRSSASLTVARTSGSRPSPARPSTMPPSKS